MRVLDLTGNAKDQFGKDATIHTESDGTPYDILIASSALSYTEGMEVVEKVRTWADYLAVGGELHLWEPSAEWTAQEIDAERMDIPFMMHAFGDADHKRRSMFTLPMLRQMLMELGLLPTKAVTQPYVIATNSEGKEFYGNQHYIIAVKLGEKVEKAWIPD